eukprot:m.239433 g.239433  ORF g.239433 m.239433 type:complete len:89 (+) comp13937_c0_seq12:2296-2562(+)
MPKLDEDERKQQEAMLEKWVRISLGLGYVTTTTTNKKNKKRQRAHHTQTVEFPRTKCPRNNSPRSCQRQLICHAAYSKHHQKHHQLQH